jgi:hypothetical protein
MKWMKYIFCLLFNFAYSYNYLSPGEYRNYEIIDDDFSTYEFFKYFILDLAYFDNTPGLYVQNCDIGTVFGYFRHGRLIKYFDYSKYGSLGINLNLLVKVEGFQPSLNDSIQFLINGEINQEYRMDNFTMNMNTPEIQDICDRQFYMFNISLIYSNNKTTDYPPLKLEIKTNFDFKNNIDWAITNFSVIKIRCPIKCSLCTSSQCVGCLEPFSKFKPQTCECDTDNSNYHDYNDMDKELNCQRKSLT